MSLSANLHQATKIGDSINLGHPYSLKFRQPTNQTDNFTNRTDNFTNQTDFLTNYPSLKF